MGDSLPLPGDIPNHCPACGKEIVLPSLQPPGDTACPHCGHLLWFVKKCRGGVVIVTFLPGLASGMEAVLRVDEVLAALGNSSRLVLNLCHLRIMSSMFLAMLTVIHRKMVLIDGAFRLCGLQRNSREALGATKLDTIWTAYEDEQSAVEGF
jgi:anti-anti-sigma regulatory factor